MATRPFIFSAYRRKRGSTLGTSGGGSALIGMLSADESVEPDPRAARRRAVAGRDRAAALVRRRQVVATWSARVVARALQARRRPRRRERGGERDSEGAHGV